MLKLEGKMCSLLSFKQVSRNMKHVIMIFIWLRSVYLQIMYLNILIKSIVVLKMIT